MPISLKSNVAGTSGTVALNGVDRITITDAGEININGSTSYTGNVTLNGTPTNTTDVTNKEYVDGQALALSIALG